MFTSRDVIYEPLIHLRRRQVVNKWEGETEMLTVVRIITIITIIINHQGLSSLPAPDAIIIPIKLIKTSGYFIYQEVQHYTFLPPIHTAYLCVLGGSENKQRLFPYTALTDWFV